MWRDEAWLLDMLRIVQQDLPGLGPTLGQLVPPEDASG